MSSGDEVLPHHDRPAPPAALVVLRFPAADGVFVGVPGVELAVCSLEAGLGTVDTLSADEAGRVAAVARRLQFAWAGLLGVVPGDTHLLDRDFHPWTALS